MKEITFLKQNHEKWLQFEALLNSKDRHNPDALADLFVRITDDLSWAHTFYPGSNTEKYLNDLAANIHQEIYKNKKEKRSRLITFWTNELPVLMGKHRLNLFIAFLIFGMSTWIGVISAQHDEGFVRIILGDEYVDQTLHRMSEGDPLGVYKDENQFVMFFRIALNNSKVALFCIVLGVFGWLGVAYMQFLNGVMLGAFFYFLVSHGFAQEATLTVWIHGTIEIWCIVVAGAAGMALGNGLWFPGAWPRGVSFMRGAREALKIGIGLIPFFFLAAFFEGFLTRYTQMNDYMRMAIIFTSLIFVVWYFIVWPFFADGKNTTRKEGSLFFFSPRLFFITNLLRKIPVTPKTVFLLFVGALLVLLPSLALVMNYITETKADYAGILFFALCITVGIGCMVVAFRGRGKVEEEDLVITRKNSVKTDDYERSASTTKI
ncbi:MAG: stage II sporulation protein M [Bacteroidota bacterium]|nr:stage II sporulation protein M [Bacteroidota bacterium]